MIKTIIFDRWYVCWDYDLSRFRKFLTRNGYDREAEREYFRTYKWAFDRAQMTEKEFRGGLKKALWYKLSVKSLIQNCDKNLIIDWKLLERIKSLREKYKIILWSNMDSTAIRQIRKEVNLSTFFDEVYFSREYKMGKIDQPVIEHIMKKCKCLASEVVFVDDEPRNFIRLSKEGYHTLVYTWRQNLKRDLKKLSIKI